MSPTDRLRRYRLGEWQVVPSENRLLGPAGEHHLQPKVMHVLEVLAEHAGGLVEREAIQQAVWGNAIVADEPLTRCIADLRAALNDDQKPRRYIETIPKRGYKLLVLPEPVDGTESRDDGEVPPATAATNRVSRFGLLAVATLVSMTIILASRPWFANEDDGLDAIYSYPAIVVLPLEVSDETNEHDFLAEGITEELIDRLSTVVGLRVISRRSSFRFQKSELALPAIADELNVNYVLTGKLRVVDDALRINVQLVGLPNETLLWSQTFDDPAHDVFEVQRTIAATVMSYVSAEMDRQGSSARLQQSLQSVSSLPGTNMDFEAYELFLKAKLLWQRREYATRGDLIEATQLVRRAIEINPLFADSYAVLGALYGVMDLYFSEPELQQQLGLSLSEMRELSLRHARHAVNLDSTNSLAHSVLGAYFMDANDWLSADRELQLALELAPSNTDARLWYATILLSAGHVDKSIDQLMTAIATDPKFGLLYEWLLYAQLVDGDLDRARKTFSLMRDVGWVGDGATIFYYGLQTGEYDLIGRSLADAYEEQVLSDENARNIASALKQGDKVTAARIIQQAGFSDYLKYYKLLLIGAYDEAYSYLQPPLAEKNRHWLNVYWHRADTELRQRAEFRRLVEAKQLPTYWKAVGFPPLCEETSESFRCN